jgi:hypothetical protein
MKLSKLLKKALSNPQNLLGRPYRPKSWRFWAIYGTLILLVFNAFWIIPAAFR